MKTLGIILARGGSKRLPNKNKLNFCGQPLIKWTINQLQNSGVAQQICVSSDNKYILDIALCEGCIDIERPSELCEDHITSEAAWLHALDIMEDIYGKYDCVVAPQVTSPIRTASNFQDICTVFENGKYDAVFSVVDGSKISIWQDAYVTPPKPVTFFREPNLGIGERRWKSNMWIENGSIYVFSPAALRKMGCRFGKNCGMYKMPYHTLIEIDDLEDFKIAEVIMKACMKGQL